MLGWSDPGVWGALLIGIVMLATFLWHEAHTAAPMLPLGLFAHRNFAVANAQTFAMYGGIGLLGFFVTIYLQQVAGYSALKSGVTGLVPTAVMFLLSARMGRLADRFGPRPFLTVGPLLVAAGFGLMQRYGTSVSLFGDVLPALLVFSLGLSLTVSPLTATVLADASEMDAGIASAVNNAIARTAGLVAVAAVGAVVSSYYATLLDQRLGHRLPAIQRRRRCRRQAADIRHDRRPRVAGRRPRRLRGEPPPERRRTRSILRSGSPADCWSSPGSAVCGYGPNVGHWTRATAPAGSSRASRVWSSPSPRRPAAVRSQRARRPRRGRAHPTKGLRQVGPKGVCRLSRLYDDPGDTRRG